MGIEISVTEFKARCLELMDKISRHEINEIRVTKRGKPIVVVSPSTARKPRTREDAMAAHQYWLKHKTVHAIKLDSDFDITGPIAADEEFEPELGNLR